jgi:hypothetical protein
MRLVCDFCTGGPVVVTYIAREFSLDLPPPAVSKVAGITRTTHVTMTPEWRACEACAALIEARDVQGLKDRSVETYAESPWGRFGPPLPSEERTRETVEVVHNGFWDNFLGKT